ncbi:MAG: hypothetical protein U0I09_07965 [Bacteroidaceae bacterium]|nr:hypothetical protein [Bacteroidaceae bacterium]
MADYSNKEKRVNGINSVGWLGYLLGAVVIFAGFFWAFAHGINKDMSTGDKVAVGFAILMVLFLVYAFLSIAFNRTGFYLDRIEYKVGLFRKKVVWRDEIASVCVKYTYESGAKSPKYTELEVVKMDGGSVCLRTETSNKLGEYYDVMLRYLYVDCPRKKGTPTRTINMHNPDGLKLRASVNNLEDSKVLKVTPGDVVCLLVSIGRSSGRSSKYADNLNLHLFPIRKDDKSEIIVKYYDNVTYAALSNVANLEQETEKLDKRAQDEKDTERGCMIASVLVLILLFMIVYMLSLAPAQG